MPQDIAWRKNDGYVDPFCPTIEPEPFSSIDEVEALRKHHLQCVANLFEITDVFVFTLGLTENWIASADGVAYPVCPGTAGGEFNASNHKLVNLSYPEVRMDMETFFARARQLKPKMRFLLFKEHKSQQKSKMVTVKSHERLPDDVVCDEELLAVFGRAE